MLKMLLGLPSLGRQVVFAREQVAVWPSSRQRIPGRLSLVKQCGVVFLTWLPSGGGRTGTASAHSSPATGELLLNLTVLCAYYTFTYRYQAYASANWVLRVTVSMQETGADRPLFCSFHMYPCHA